TVTGLQGASFGVQVTVPAGATPGTIDLTVVVGSSAMDPNATGNSNVVLEYYGPGPADWPTFHNTNQRRGASPNLFGPPMSQLWTAPGTRPPCTPAPSTRRASCSRRASTSSSGHGIRSWAPRSGRDTSATAAAFRSTRVGRRSPTAWST